MIAGRQVPWERPDTTQTSRVPLSPDRCSTYQARRREQRRKALRRRYVLMYTLLAAVLPTVLMSLYAVGVGDSWLGWAGIFVAFGLIYFADQVERG